MTITRGSLRGWKARFIALLSLGFLSACMIPIPSTRNVAMAGGVKTTRPNLDGIRAGVTSRGELEQLVGSFHADASDSVFFWARWEEAMLPFKYDSRNASDRDWRIVNVLAVSDSRGILSHYRVCSERNLAECLYFMAAHAPEPGCSVPALAFQAHRWATLWGTDRFHGSITFSERGAILWGDQGNTFRPHTPINFEVGWRQIDRIRVRFGSSANSLRLTIHFKPVVSGVDYVSILASPCATWRLIRTYRSALPAPDREY